MPISALTGDSYGRCPSSENCKIGFRNSGVVYRQLKSRLKVFEDFAPVRLIASTAPVALINGNQIKLPRTEEARMVESARIVLGCYSIAR